MLSVPNSQMIAVSSSGYVNMWDPMTGKKREDFPQIDAGANLMAFSPDGRKMALSLTGISHPYLWELSTGKNPVR